MMDGRVGRIRGALDVAGFSDAAIMSYAAKYRSAFYGPFREAADSAPAFGDRRTYQMDPANVEEALREVALDIEEGADIVMVKPAITYLDVIARVKGEFDMPMLPITSAASTRCSKPRPEGWIDEPRAMMETLIAIRRAGADIIITYFAREAARLLRSSAGGLLQAVKGFVRFRGFKGGFRGTRGSAVQGEVQGLGYRPRTKSVTAVRSPGPAFSASSL